jgi:hypothetical protein
MLTCDRCVGRGPRGGGTAMPVHQGSEAAKLLRRAIDDPDTVLRYRSKVVSVPGSACVWWAAALSGRGHGRERHRRIDAREERASELLEGMRSCPLSAAWAASDSPAIAVPEREPRSVARHLLQAHLNAGVRLTRTCRSRRVPPLPRGLGRRSAERQARHVHGGRAVCIGDLDVERVGAGQEPAGDGERVHEVVVVVGCVRQ